MFTTCLFGGYRMRSRDILSPNQHGGRACPHLAEFQPCLYRTCYDWAVRSVGQCRLTTGQLCGHGRRNLTVDCQYIDGVSQKRFNGDVVDSNQFIHSTRSPFCLPPDRGDAHAGWYSIYRPRRVEEPSWRAGESGVAQV